MTRRHFLRVLGATIVLPQLCALVGRAEDWPQFRGPNRDAVWNEAGILKTFPPEGLKIRWRASVGGGLSSPVVAQGRVYQVGAELNKPKSREGIQCFDQKSGRLLWIYSYDVSYPDWASDQTQNGGPNATPVVQDGRIYTLGQMGDLLCLDAVKGTVIWQKNLMKGYGMLTSDLKYTLPRFTPSPVIEGSLLILVIGSQPGASVIALNKDSGKETWKALDDPWTYNSPIVISAGGKRQLIIWTPKAVTSLDPATGQTWWREVINTINFYAVATPVLHDDRLLLSGLMFQLDQAHPAASVLWPEKKSAAKVILSSTCMPMAQGGHVYAGKSSGHLVCLDARTGTQLWETDRVTGIAPGATIHLTPNGDTALIFTDEGNLIRARLSPEGYTELSRVHLVDPTYPFGARKLVWPPPAYANGHVFIHNDKELVCASLEEMAVHAK
jgi:outer membrane protein assembly factor BamB